MRSKFLTTIQGSFVKHFLTAVITLYIYELTEGLDPFAINLAMAKKFMSAGLISSLPVVLNWLNRDDSRYGFKPKSGNFPTEPKDLKE